jgi:hypothetical protein
VRMTEPVTERAGVRTLLCAADGPKLDSEQAAVDVIGDALGQRAEFVMIPLERLDERFFTLDTGLAGEILQKFATYRLRVAVIGDISGHLEDSKALRDMVHESNNGKQVWFLADESELEHRLQAEDVTR